MCLGVMAERRIRSYVSIGGSQAIKASALASGVFFFTDETRTLCLRLSIRSEKRDKI